jgi:hypothetical protein
MYGGEVSFEVGFYTPIEELLRLAAVEEEGIDIAVLPKERIEIVGHFGFSLDPHIERPWPVAGLEDIP